MKGKYATRAANRTEAADREATEAAYQRRVLKLTEERDAARAERDAARAEAAKESRILRAQLAEGTSSRVEALTRTLEEVRAQREGLERWRRDAREQYGRAYGRIAEHLKSEHELSVHEAAEAAFELVTGDFRRVVSKGADKKFAELFGEEALITLRKARGL